MWRTFSPTLEKTSFKFYKNFDNFMIKSEHKNSNLTKSVENPSIWVFISIANAKTRNRTSHSSIFFSPEPLFHTNRRLTVISYLTREADAIDGMFGSNRVDATKMKLNMADSVTVRQWSTRDVDAAASRWYGHRWRLSRLVAWEWCRWVITFRWLNLVLDIGSTSRMKHNRVTIVLNVTFYLCKNEKGIN